MVSCSRDVHDFDFEFEWSLEVPLAPPPCSLNQRPKVFADQLNYPHFVPQSHRYLMLLASHFQFFDPHLPVANQCIAYKLRDCWSFLSGAFHRVPGFHRENKRWESFHT